jgi:hypothetical protein
MCRWTFSDVGRFMVGVSVRMFSAVGRFKFGTFRNRTFTFGRFMMGHFVMGRFVCASKKLYYKLRIN